MRIVVATLVALGLSATFTRASAQEAQAQLWDAATAGDTAAISQAIRNGADVHALDTRRSRNGRRALNWAALNNQVAAIRVLLTAGAGLDSTNLTGFTALHHAAEVGALEAAQVLLDAGADARLLNRAGFTPAAVARGNGFEKLATILEAAESPK